MLNNRANKVEDRATRNEIEPRGKYLADFSWEFLMGVIYSRIKHLTKEESRETMVFEDLSMN